MLRWASRVFREGLSAFPNVMRHHTRLLADPGVVRAMTAEGLLDHS